MRAVWSFWSKPFVERKGRTWQEPKHHFYAWGLSLRLARQHYPDTLLVTDTPGKELLIDQLGLEFAQVSTELDKLRDVDHGWWAMGKLVAYSMQDRPFVHLDTDVFLWKPLPSWLTAAAVFGQCPEEHSCTEDWGGPANVERAFQKHNLDLPAEWEWVRSRSISQFREVNCGILGGTRTDFLRYYANLAIDLVLHPKNAAAWAEFPNKDGYNQIIEQFLLFACIDFHRVAPQSPYRSVNVRYLFPSLGQAFDEDAAAQVGFTHLLGDVKTHPTVSDRLERRMAAMDLSFQRHCQRVAELSLATGT